MAKVYFQTKCATCGKVYATSVKLDINLTNDEIKVSHGACCSACAIPEFVQVLEDMDCGFIAGIAYRVDNKKLYHKCHFVESYIEVDPSRTHTYLFVWSDNEDAYTIQDHRIADATSDIFDWARAIKTIVVLEPKEGVKQKCLSA